jgi:peptide/nickel transport system substrate-binding protein
VASTGAGCALVLSACGGGGDSGSSDSAAKEDQTPATATTTAPATGDLDVLRWRLNQEPPSIDYQAAYTESAMGLASNLCDSVMRYTPDFEIEPGLAKSVSNPNPTTYVFQLRDDVRFWNGRRMTPDDVIFNVLRAKELAYGSYINALKSLEQTGPNEVTAKLSYPDYTFLEGLATAPGFISDAEYVKEAGDDYGNPTTGLMCSGPFKFVRWNPGRSIEVERNEEYWDKSRTIRPKKVEFQFILDEKAAVNALLSGDIDGTYFTVPPAGFDELSQSEAVTVSLGRSTIFWPLISTATSGPWADARIRQALSLAIDRRQLADQVWPDDLAEPAKALLGPGAWGFEPEIFKEAYDALPSIEPDIERAKQLVVEAGSPSEPIRIGVQAGTTINTAVADIIQATGQEIGLNIQVKTWPPAVFNDFVSDPQKVGDIIILQWFQQGADPLEMYSLFFPESGVDFSQYENPELDALVEQARQGKTPEERARLVAQVQELVTQDQVWVPLVHQSNILVTSSRITGVTPSFMFINYPFAIDAGTP